jgi:hypothetical protein
MKYLSKSNEDFISTQDSFFIYEKFINGKKIFEIALDNKSDDKIIELVDIVMSWNLDKENRYENFKEINPKYKINFKKNEYSFDSVGDITIKGKVIENALKFVSEKQESFYINPVEHTDELGKNITKNEDGKTYFPRIQRSNSLSR